MLFVTVRTTPQFGSKELPAHPQYHDAPMVIDFLQQLILQDQKATTTYSEVAQGALNRPTSHGTHVGQVCSLLDAVCFTARLPFLFSYHVMMTNRQLNTGGADGLWVPANAQLQLNVDEDAWIDQDFARMRDPLIGLMDEGMPSASVVWQAINLHGQAAVDDALTYR